MPASDCINKLVKAGRISRALGDEALALYRRSLGEYTEIMGPASAEAAAALSLARALEAGAAKMANDQAKQASAWARFEQRMLEHPKGRVAGMMSQLTRDIWEHGGENVYTKTEVVWATLAQKFEAGMKVLEPGLLGQTAQQLDNFQAFVREVFGVDTKNPTAKAMAQGWKDATDEASSRMLAAGHNFEPNEDWRIWQYWNPTRVRKFSPEEFKRDILEHVDSGAIKLWDKDTGKPATAARRDFILNRAHRDITANDNSPSAFSREQRTFQFAEGEEGAGAWLALQEKYGAGDNAIGMTTGHLFRASREIALAEVIGPNHEAIISAGMRQAREQELSGVMKFLKFLESPAMVQRTYDVLTGKADRVEGPMIAGILGGMRSLNTASKLGGAIISAVPGDSVTAGLAANYNGMAVGRIASGMAREVARGGEASRDLAARIQLTAHSAMEYSHGYRYFQDQIAGPETLRAIGTFAVRAQGLQAWTELIKRTFSMEFLGHLSDHAGHSLDDLRGGANEALGRFLDRHQISAPEWDNIRAGAPLDVGNAKFLDPATIADRTLREKLIGAIADERAFAVLEPDARVRAITTGGLPAGTFWGEAARNTFLFKSFSLSMAATHIMRLATQGPIESRLWNAAAFTLFHIVAGAMALQAKNIVYGKDPERMDKPEFWAKSAIQGGGLGVYGDLVNSAFTRSGRNPFVELAGPVAQTGEDLARLTSKQVRILYEGKDTTLGAEVTRIGRQMTPKTFYTRLAVDRLIWDQIQTMVDKDYRGSFRRIEERAKKDSGQRFWWRPGETAPTRAPQLPQ